MELLHMLCYNILHETIWQPKAIGEAPPTRCPVTEKGQNNFVGSSGEVGIFQKFCFQMVEDLPEERGRRSKPQTCARSSSEINKGAEKGTGTSSSERRFKMWLPERSLDTEAYCQADISAFSHSLSSQSCMAGADKFGIELPKARTASRSERRKGNSKLETKYLAQYKKKPKDAKRISFLSTKADSCLSQILNAPGRSEGKHPTSIITTAQGRYPALMLSQYLPSENICLSTSNFITTTLQDWRWKPSSKSFLNSCRDLFLSCGIEVAFINIIKLEPYCLNIRESLMSSFQHMLQNLILQNMFGTRWIQPYPTLHLKIYQSLDRNSQNPSVGFRVLNNSCGLASTLPVYPGIHSFLFH